MKAGSVPETGIASANVLRSRGAIAFDFAPGHRSLARAVQTPEGIVPA